MFDFGQVADLHEHRVRGIRAGRVGLVADAELVDLGVVELRRVGLDVRGGIQLPVDRRAPGQAARLALEHLAPGLLGRVIAGP